MLNYAKIANPTRVPQSESIPGAVPNSAGGYSFPLDHWARLERFLVLGSEGGTYYIAESKLTRENAGSVVECWGEDPQRTAETIVRISVSGRAPKNDPAIFATALGTVHDSFEARKFAYRAVMPRVCRTGTHLFQFIAMRQTLRKGWSRGLRSSVANWYTSKLPDWLALQLVKYRMREDWTHRDLMRCVHAEFLGSHAALADWVCHRGKPGYRWPDEVIPMPPMIRAFEELQAAQTAHEAADIVINSRAPWEALRTEHNGDALVQAALLESMPLGAMVRQLGRLTASGVLAPLSVHSSYVIGRLSDQSAIKRARLHPLNLLTASRVYGEGKGLKGKLSWSPVQAITSYLEKAFYLAFETVEPTNKRIMLALDVSGSMTGGRVGGSPLSPREASAAMALVTMNTEPNWIVGGFTSGGRNVMRKTGGKHTHSHVSRFGGGLTGDAFSLLDLTPGMRLKDATDYVSKLGFGGTDCALPMVYALGAKIPVDAFVIYTDSETWAGDIHPYQALNEYRRVMNIPAKLIVVGMTSNGFSIADPKDGGMLDVVGFDRAAPAIIADFIRGNAARTGVVEDDD